VADALRKLATANLMPFMPDMKNMKDPRS
jgi:hypothetical protein